MAKTYIESYDPESTMTLGNQEPPEYHVRYDNPFKLVLHPDPTLRTFCQPVEDYSDINQTVHWMKNIMQAHSGIGLAAPQVGLNKRIILVGATPHYPMAMINPSIVESRGEQLHREGCLSFPKLYMTVKRAANITVQYFDQQGKLEYREAGGILAVCIQHEIDHLDGKLFIDHVSRMKYDLAIKKRDKALQKG